MPLYHFDIGKAKLLVESCLSEDTLYSKFIEPIQKLDDYSFEQLFKGNTKLNYNNNEKNIDFLNLLYKFENYSKILYELHNKDELFDEIIFLWKENIPISKFYELTEEEREKELMEFRKTKNKTGLSYKFIYELLYILRRTNGAKAERINLDITNNNNEPVDLKNNSVSNIISHNIDNIIKNNKFENTNIINMPNNINCNDNNIIGNKTVDIIYLIDSTGSMGAETKKASKLIIENSIDLNKKYLYYDFQFGIVFYNDPIDCQKDKNDFFQLGRDIDGIKKFCDNWANQSGGDDAEDWVGGYDIALNKILWRNGKKIIVHICDAPAHGKKYSKNSGDNHKEKKFEKQLDNLIIKCAKNNIEIVGLYKKDSAKFCFEECQKIYNENRGRYFSVQSYNPNYILLNNLANP